MACLAMNIILYPRKICICESLYTQMHLDEKNKFPLTRNNDFTDIL